MAITNELSNHVGEIRAGLMKESLITPDRTLQLLDTRARFKTGAAGAGFSFSHLRNTPDVQFYTGADQLQATEFNPKTNRLIVPWANCLSPIQFYGTDLNQMVGLTTAQMMKDDYRMSDMAEDQQIVFMDQLKNASIASASGIQNARVQVLWGREGKYQAASADRLPTSLPELFDDTTGLYGEDIDALGDFEKGHPWESDYAFGASKKTLMTPRVWYLNDDEGANTGTKVATAEQANAQSISSDEGLQRLYDCISAFSQVVPGTKVGICDVRTFSSLALKYAKNMGNNTPSGYPSRVGTDRWSISVKSVQIEDTYFISDPFKSADDESIFVIHLGDTGGVPGTVYPFYWESALSLPELLKRETEQMLRDIPDGLTWGMRRDVPFYMDEFMRFAGNADAIGTVLRLMWMLICTEPWCQLAIRKVGP